MGGNVLNFETTPEELINKLLTLQEVLKKSRLVCISGIAPHNDKLNNKALEVNQKLSKKCKEAKFDQIDHKIIRII